MTVPEQYSTPGDLGTGTVVELFFEAVDRFGDRPAFKRREDDQWLALSYEEARDTVQKVARGLTSLGLRRGDRAAILSVNRPEWALADYGCLCAGVVDVPIYPSLTPPQIEYILNDSESRLIFVSDAEQLKKVEELREACPGLEHVVVFTPSGDLPGGTLRWSQFLEGESGAPSSGETFRSTALSAEPEEVATVLYTSGTTGDPKGVMLTHNNLFSNVRACSQVLPIDSADSTLSFLPLSHVLQRMVEYLLFNLGCSIGYARSLQLVTEDLKHMRPTIVVSVPRLYEKVYSAVTEAEGVKGALVRWASRVGENWADVRLAGGLPGPWTRLRHGLADRLVFRKIRDALGGRLRYFVSGGAPLAPHINRFFFSAGVMILEGYGLTETSPVTNVNSPRDFPANFRIGTVGKPVPGTEERIAEDGEILIRGPQVMKGYYNLPERTREALAPDGWFHTGDIGELDEDGFLRITDRKKDIIVTAGGKNVAPQPIENRLKKNRYVDQPVLIGDRRKFITLLLVPDFDALESWARGRGLSTDDRRQLLTTSEVQEFLESEVLGELTYLSRVEMPKKLVLLEKAFTIEDGSLTPTQKVKRRVVEKRYQTTLDAVYQEANQDRTVFVSW